MAKATEVYNKNKIHCLLVGAPHTSLTELQSLVKTLDMDPIQTIILNRQEPTPVYGMGSGKAQEIVTIAKAEDAECIIFDFEIEPTKQRNWEKLAKIPVFDRNEVILRIFAQRAITKEAVIQVQLAQLEYSLPRLAHTYGSLARQRGGSYGAKGSGEKQLELDRRGVKNKIAALKKDLQKVSSMRNTQRKQRESKPIASCALVGYTNAGKSSLLNTLTGAEVLVEDKLFATLDPTTRRLPLEGGTSILVTDTVGFITNIPHTLIDAFKSTLEETVRADLLLIVIDASDINALQQYTTVKQVLKEIKANLNNILIVLNKIDKITNTVNLLQLETQFPGAIKTSTITNTGLEKLKNRISEKLTGEIHDFIIPLDQANKVQAIHQFGHIYAEEWKDDCVHITARIKGKTLAQLSSYLIN